MVERFPADIEKKLEQDYPLESVHAVSRSLATYQGSERYRVVRCIVHLSMGDPELVAHFLSVAAQDYRDVIHWAEYDRDDRKVHDFNEPFAQT
jgi:hypothetical protein